MAFLFALLMLPLLLLFPQTVMDAASDACRLFVQSVLPGLMPYMVFSLMVVSRVRRISPALLLLLGWGGGSPTGGRLLGACPGMTARQRVRLAVGCATMSPMFLLGTVGGWLGSARAGVCVLISVMAGGWLAGQMAGILPRRQNNTAQTIQTDALPFGQAVEQTMRTMLLVCGTMAVLRVLASLAAQLTDAYIPVLTLPLHTFMEVTTGTVRIASLPLPLPLRTALIAGATGFGGMASVMQNRAVWPREMLSLPEQLWWQAVHGAASGLMALGLMLL